MAAAPDAPARSLQDHFKTLDPSQQGSGWNACWEEEWTPWDRGGHSWALYDLLKEHPEELPAAAAAAAAADRPKNADGGAATASASARKTALVPGCGRGHDVLLLRSFGYDVYGLDYSPKAIELARKNAEKKPVVEGLDDAGGDESRGDKGGSVTWLSGDFFEDDWLREAGISGRKFDLIFDYTFLCALHPSQRPRWAARMRDLLAPSGRLVCLEFPSREPTEPGPPWALPPHTYVAYLSQPGDHVETDEFGGVLGDEIARHTDGLVRTVHAKPRRTFAAGATGGGIQDWIAIWKHRS